MDVGANVDFEFSDSLDHFSVDLDKSVDDRVDVDGEETAAGQRIGGSGSSIICNGSRFNGRVVERRGDERLSSSSVGTSKTTDRNHVSETSEETAETAGRGNRGGRGGDGKNGQGQGGSSEQFHFW